MMNNLLHLKNLSELHKLMEGPELYHPLISVIDLANFTVPPEYLHKKIINSFYTVTLKSKTSDHEFYAKKACDFGEGMLFAQSPEFVFSIVETIEKGDYEGWVLYFHPDLFLGTELFKQIQTYTFFSYQSQEALHMSTYEKAKLMALIAQIGEECKIKNR
jgi:hypothetical protein